MNKINTVFTPNPRLLRGQASLRILGSNPNHHLWSNHGTWWLHYTLHLPDYTKKRIRKSLQTSDVEQARIRRDQIINELKNRAVEFCDL